MKKIIFWNGGSAADAQHLCAELLVRLRPSINRQPIAAIALAMDTSTIKGETILVLNIYLKGIWPWPKGRCFDLY